MSTSMIVLIVVLGAMSLLSLVWSKPLPASKPTGTGNAVHKLVSWFLAAWVVSEFGSYALAGVYEIGYWQAFFGVIALRTAVTITHHTSWREYDASERHKDPK